MALYLEENLPAVENPDRDEAHRHVEEGVDEGCQSCIWNPCDPMHEDPAGHAEGTAVDPAADYVQRGSQQFRDDVSGDSVGAEHQPGPGPLAAPVVDLDGPIKQSENGERNTGCDENVRTGPEL